MAARQRDTSSTSDAKRQKTVADTPEKPIDSSMSEAIPQTPSKKSRPSEPKLPVNTSNIRVSLAEHGMRFNDWAALDDRCPEFKPFVLEIFEKERGSAMTERSAKAAVKTLQHNYTQNEITLFGKLRPKVIKDARSVPVTEFDAVGNLVFVSKSFEEDGLENVGDCQFVRTLLPGRDYSADEKAMGLAEPKPDVTFGRQQNLHPKLGPVPSKELQALKRVAPGMEWPFFVIEHKSGEEGIAVAENQAIRDGAVIVNSRLILNEKLQRPKYVAPPGADYDSFVFSCAWTPDLARIFVHWTEMQKDGGRLWHMHELFSYMIAREQEIAQLRRHIHTILDWGLFTYAPEAQRVFEKVLARPKS
ncbi:MAG: hypothetical protein LQ338_007776 [Usnochroma carphineum]|nr:MAG: hypothetical protein LQ338_007776 [Usnochroma carphineum]